MTHRIDSYLDGALDRAALPLEERAQADAIERVIGESRAFVNARPAPDMTAAVMNRIARAEPVAARGVLSFAGRVAGILWTPRDVSIRVRPAYGLIAAAALAVFVILVPDTVRSLVETPSQSSAPRLFVQFRLEAPQASTVRLAGSFTDWQPRYELHQSAPGLWSVTLALPVGVHDYAFVVDGQSWVRDPYVQAVDDGFGGANSRIALLPPADPRS